MRGMRRIAATAIAVLLTTGPVLAQACDDGDCPEGFYCHRPVGQCDGPGECMQKPDGCGGNYDPVCGCDGVTYSNGCVAAANGVNVAYLGECGTPCQDNGDCADTHFCLKPVGECDGDGICMERPLGCPDVFDPVCACNGETYSNYCDAFAAGTSIAHQGYCGIICPADVTHDLRVDVLDLVQVVLGWGECFDPYACVADTNDDNVVDVVDLVNVVLAWGPCEGAAQFLCEQSAGTWDPLACGHYVCGLPRECAAIIPGCDCGPGRNFVEGVGCVDDPECP